MLEASIEVVQADAGYIRVFEPGEEEPLSSRYPFVVHKGISQPYLDYFGSLRRPVNDAARQAVYEGRRVFVADMTSDPAFGPHRDVVVAEGYKTLQATPMMSRHGARCIGVVCTYFRHIQDSPLEGVETLDLYAELAASIIERQQLVQELAQQNQLWGELAIEQADALHLAYDYLKKLEPNAVSLQSDDVAREAHELATRIGHVMRKPGIGESQPNGEDQHSENPYGLSPGELEVLINVWRGLSDKEAAEGMGVSRFTVAKYLGSAMRKLNVEDRAQASVLVERDILSGKSGRSLRFGDLLRTFRRRSGQTQFELAEKAGLSHRTISDLERGVRTKVYISTVNLISAALELEQRNATLLAASVDRSRKTSSRQAQRTDGTEWSVS